MHPVIMLFNNPHEVGSVCLPPCKQCGETENFLGYMCGADGERLPPVPMRILREASREEWIEQHKQSGSKVPLEPNKPGYLYAVLMD